MQNVIDAYKHHSCIADAAGFRNQIKTTDNPTYTTNSSSPWSCIDLIVVVMHKSLATCTRNTTSTRPASVAVKRVARDLSRA